MSIARLRAVSCLAWVLAAGTFGQDSPSKRVAGGALASLADQLRARHVDLSRTGLLAALRSPDDKVRYLAALRLAEEADTDAVPTIEDALKVEKIPETRTNIAIALVQLGQGTGAVELSAECERRNLCPQKNCAIMVEDVTIGWACSSSL